MEESTSHLLNYVSISFGILAVVLLVVLTLGFLGVVQLPVRYIIVKRKVRKDPYSEASFELVQKFFELGSFSFMSISVSAVGMGILILIYNAGLVIFSSSTFSEHYFEFGLAIGAFLLSGAALMAALQFGYWSLKHAFSEH
ncbi:hypothetical protein [Ruegeria sp. HKCCE4150]|uniref:hypothetical protein n=1 Tax=Ruegeria sp. HKCCE4150 TaxID=2794828 RepID=UPI001AE8147D|nr:hypothetical protein [Ruegeria sp. HKCCE4150]